MNNGRGVEMTEEVKDTDTVSTEKGENLLEITQNVWKKKIRN